jgi:DNA-binding transcriptional regulator YdaS (Cro superfamily)
MFDNHPMKLHAFITSQQITPAAFARILGNVSGEAVRLWASGRRMPEPETAQRIVEATGGAVTVQDLHDTRLQFLRNPPQPRKDT